MFLSDGETSFDHLLMIKRLAASVTLVLLLVRAIVPAHAQGNFSSGSTGTDGAFAPTANITVQLPENGVFNYTTVNIPSGVTITFKRNSKNAPVTILASGNVAIAGAIALDGEGGALHKGGTGGPGGFNGGAGGIIIDGYNLGTTGDGPGGGAGGRFVDPTNGPIGGGGAGFSLVGGNGGGSNQVMGVGGPRYGTNTLLPLIGGSGGGGGGSPLDSNFQGGSGGGGGGAILIASSGSITLTGSIHARGGAGSNASGECSAGGGGGSGGAIRLVANAITGSGTLDVGGGGGGGGSVFRCSPQPQYQHANGGRGSSGFVRIEAFDLSSFSIAVAPNDSTAISITQPKPAILPNAPQLTIASVAGITAPTSPRGSLSGAPDIVIPTTQTTPVPVVIQGANLSVGTPVQVTVTPENGARTPVNCTLAGSQTSSTCTANVLLPTTGLSVISATATIELMAANARPLFINGERVDRVEVAAVYGGASEVTYITRSGRRIKRAE